MVCALAVNARHMLRLHAAAAAEREGGLLEAWRAEARDAWTGDAPWPRVVHSPRPTPAPSTMQAATEEIDAERAAAARAEAEARRKQVDAERAAAEAERRRHRVEAERAAAERRAQKEKVDEERAAAERAEAARLAAERARTTPAPSPRPTNRETPAPTPDRYEPRDRTTPAPTPDRYEPRDRTTPAPVAPPKKASRAVVAVDTKYSVNSTRRMEHAEANALATGKAVPCRARRSQNNTWLGVRVLVTGLSRSGSTWQYNAVKSMLEQYVRRRNLPADEYEVHGAHADGDAAAFDACLSSRICVLKTHIFVPRLVNQVDVILTSHRDVRDVVLSSMLMFGACFAPTGSTRTQRSHGVALRFQQYAHWAPYVCYDAIYERMKLNYTSEVQRLSRAVLGNENAVDASAVVQHVDELANRKPTSC